MYLFQAYRQVFFFKCGNHVEYVSLARWGTQGPPGTPRVPAGRPRGHPEVIASCRNVARDRAGLVAAELRGDARGQACKPWPRLWGDPSRLGSPPSTTASMHAPGVRWSPARPPGRIRTRGMLRHHQTTPGWPGGGLRGAWRLPGAPRASQRVRDTYSTEYQWFPHF